MPREGGAGEPDNAVLRRVEYTGRAGACSHWWGHPNRPKLVGAFLEAVDNPRHEHWGEGGKGLKDLPSVPAELVEHETARTVLLEHPWKLGADTADRITWAGIRYVRW